MVTNPVLLLPPLYPLLLLEELLTEEPTAGGTIVVEVQPLPLDKPTCSSILVFREEIADWCCQMMIWIFIGFVAALVASTISLLQKTKTSPS